METEAVSRSHVVKNMFKPLTITFVVAVNNKELLEKNFMASPCLRKNSRCEVIVQEGFESAAKAYNDAIDRSLNNLIVFAHQDVIFPASWISDLGRALRSLAVTDPGWGVLGCYGETLNDKGRGYVYSFGLHGKAFDVPAPIQTLDEIVLIMRKSSGLRFDERLPHFHLYGAGICLAAAAKGMRSYAISAFCIHNAQQNFVLPKEFYDCYWSFKRIWGDYLPVQTTCIRITRFNFPMFERRLQEAYLRIKRKRVGATRVADVKRLLEEYSVAP